ncbi:MAG: DUF4230 domain-containing protein [Bacteroidia bacterium]|nr:DUF4230 domain-containing protein [Bacteroidia bacterium]
MITALAALFTRPFGRALGLVLVGVVGGILIWTFLHKPGKVRQVTAKALLTNISYVQELDLVSHYYDEIMFIGDALEQERLADQASEDTLPARAALENALIEMNIQQEVVNDSNAALQKLIATLNYANQKVDSTLPDKKGLPENFQAFQKAIEQSPNRFGPEYNQLRLEYLAAEKELDDQVKMPKALWDAFISKKSKNYPLYQKYKAKEDAFRQAYQDLKGALKDNLEAARKYRDLVRSRKEKCERALNKERNEFTRRQREYLNAKENFEELKTQAKIAREKANAAREAAKKDINLNDPKLLAIIPSTITGYIDMKDVVWDTAGSDTVRVSVKDIKLSRVYIDLDKVESYGIAPNEVEVDFKKGGLYYQVFVQMRRELADLRDRVTKNAVKNGITRQTAEMACEYFESLFGTFGLPVTVSFPNNPGCDCANKLVPRMKEEEKPPVVRADSNGTASQDTTPAAVVNTAGIF